MKIKFAQSARRHRVGKARALHVIHNPRVQFIVPDPDGRDDRLLSSVKMRPAGHWR